MNKAIQRLQKAMRTAQDQNAQGLLLHAVKYLRNESIGQPGCYSSKLQPEETQLPLKSACGRFHGCEEMYNCEDRRTKNDC